MRILLLLVAPWLLSSCSEPDRTAFTPLTRADLQQFTQHPAQERDPTFSPDEKWILFGSLRSGNEDLWKKPIGGGEAIQFTSDPARDLYGDWSPDGTEILFLSNRGGTNNVWITSADGTSTRRVTTDADSVNNAQDSYASFSPDGSEIVFSARRDGQLDLWLIAAQGGTARQLTHHPMNDVQPHYAPDGQHIAFLSNRSGNWDIWIMPAAGGTARQLTTDPASDIQPRFSPDGQWVAFSSLRNGPYDIWVAPTEGGAAQQITDLPHSLAYKANWSGDGRRITFNASPLLGELWHMRADGSQPQRLAQGIRVGEGWRAPVGVSPDGRQVAFVAPSSAGMDIWSMAAAGGPWTQVTHMGLIRGYCASFSPDGKQIAFLAGNPGNFNLWTIALSGGEPNQITISPPEESMGCGKWSPDGQYLVYHMNKAPQGRDIWKVPATGGPTQRIVDRKNEVWDPDLSPNGQHLVFTERTRPSIGFDIWIQSIVDGEATFLTKGVSPAWSPDGREILFAGGLALTAESNIWKISADGGEPTPILVSPFSDSYPTWSADGQGIFFYRAAEDDIWIADIGAAVGSP
ncbi:MAG: TolB protein [Candidatus Latescibacterota bacterium]|jgi:TolB protein